MKMKIAKKIEQTRTFFCSSSVHIFRHFLFEFGALQ